MVHEASAGFQFHEQIEIAPLIGFISRYGPEDPNIAGAMFCGDSEDLLAFLLQELFHPHIRFLFAWLE
jgi:hypothetical protein